MRSPLFQQPTQEALLKRILSQCSSIGSSSTVCIASLNRLLRDLKNSKDTEVQNETQKLLTVLIDEGIYTLRDGIPVPLRFDIPTTSSILVDAIETALLSIQAKLFPSTEITEEYLLEMEPGVSTFSTKAPQ